LAEIKQTLYDMGAWYAAMSGSGSAVFGLFEKTPERRNFEHQTFQSVL
jgi:4-diphosphocytidyl-2-C-methyl-D-erythritol kinase